MATNTYVALDKITVSGTSTTSVTFSSVPQGYTDLVLVISGSLYGAANRTSFVVQVGNGSIDTGTNYSSTWVAGNGTTAVSSRYSNGTNFLTGHISEAVGTTIVNFMNYANTSIYKTFIARGNSVGQVGSFDVGAFASLWRSTSAINTIKIYPNDGTPYNSGSTFSLYGIKSAAVGAKATGGVIASDATYMYHVFPSSGTFTPTQSLSADILVVAGGGGSGYDWSGSGGAGGVQYLAGQSLSATGYTVTVGGGGASATAQGVQGSTGGNSTFGSTIVNAIGGGGAHCFSAGNANSGGSGGGGGTKSGTSYGGAATAGTGGTFYGNAGGNGTYPTGVGGGGGAGAAGGTNTGIGGVGTSAFSSWGVATGYGHNVNGTYYFAGGGDGAVSLPVNGGGGAYGQRGFANTGGGAGSDNLNGAGGSGIVIVRYAK